MPLDADEEWSNDRVMSLTEILKLISSHHEIVPLQRGNAPQQDGSTQMAQVKSVLSHSYRSFLRFLRPDKTNC